MQRLRPAAGSVALSLVTFALVMAGLVLLLSRDDDFTRLAAAATGDQLEIAPGNTTDWATEVGPVWNMVNAAPGQSVSGSVELRTVGEALTVPAWLQVETEFDGGVPPLAGQLHITAMSLGGEDLLPRWSPGCVAPGAVLTLARLATCDSPPQLPAPPADGTTFSMTVEFNPAAGNAYQGSGQGEASGAMTVLFSLHHEAVSPTPSVEPTATGTATAQSTATPDGAATPEPTEPATPEPTEPGTGTATATPTDEPTAPPSATATASPTATPTASASPTGTASPTATETPTMTAGPSTTATVAPTGTAQPSRTATVAPTRDVPRPRPTRTPVPPSTGSGHDGDSGQAGIALAGVALSLTGATSMLMLARRRREQIDD